MIEFRSQLQEVFVGFFLNGNKGNIVLAPGMPQYLDKYHPLVVQASKLGYNLFIPRYMGTFESSGTFSSLNSSETLAETIRMVKKGKTTELFAHKEMTWSSEKIYLLGFSYGALPALLQTEDVSKTILVCPFISLEYHRKGSSGEDIQETYEFLERAYPNLYRLKTAEVIRDLERTTLPAVKENLVVVSGDKDMLIPKVEIQALLQKYHPVFMTKDTGHSLSMDDTLFLKLFS